MFSNYTFQIRTFFINFFFELVFFEFFYFILFQNFFLKIEIMFETIFLIFFLKKIIIIYIFIKILNFTFQKPYLTPQL